MSAILSSRQVQPRHLKLLFWGDTGTRKTESILRFFPNVLLIDTEGNKIAPWFGIDAYNIGYAAGEWMADYATENNMTEDETVGVLYMTMNTTSSCVPSGSLSWMRTVSPAAGCATTLADASAGGPGLKVVASAAELPVWLSEIVLTRRSSLSRSE